MRRSLASQTGGWGVAERAWGGAEPSGAGVGGGGGAEVSLDEGAELRESKVFAHIEATRLQTLPPKKNNLRFHCYDITSCEGGVGGACEPDLTSDPYPSPWRQTAAHSLFAGCSSGSIKLMVVMSERGRG